MSENNEERKCGGLESQLRLAGHGGAVRFLSSVSSRKQRGEDHLLPALNFFEPLCWNLPWFSRQTLLKPLWGSGRHAGAGEAKTVSVDGIRRADQTENSSAGVSAGSEGHRGYKEKGNPTPYVALAAGMAMSCGQGGLLTEDRAANKGGWAGGVAGGQKNENWLS